MPTIGTTLTRRIPLVDFDQGSTVPFSLVFKLRDKLAPTDVSNSLTEFGVFDHVLDCQRLNADRLVFTDQSG